MEAVPRGRSVSLDELCLRARPERHGTREVALSFEREEDLFRAFVRGGADLHELTPLERTQGPVERRAIHDEGAGELAERARAAAAEDHEDGHLGRAELHGRERVLVDPR